MADFQQNFLASLGAGYNFGQQIKQQRDQNQLNQLASQAYGAAPEQRDSLLSQTAAVDAGAAQGLEKQMAYSDERRDRTMVNMARLLQGAPEQARAAIYDQMVPTLSRFIPSGLPPKYTPESSPVIMQAAKSLVDASMGATGTPTDVRSFQMMTAGLSPEDQMRARRINLGLDGRASSSGFSQVKFTGADGRERIGVLNGKTGQIDLPDGTSFNPQTGAISATSGAPQGDTSVMAEDGSSIPMRTVTGPGGEVYRVELGSANAAQTGAADMASDGMAQRVELPQRTVLQQRPASGGAFVGRSPEEQAALTEQAKANVELANLPTKLNMQTEAEIAKSRGVEQAKSEQERASNERAKTAQLNNVDRGLSRIDTAIKALSGGMVNTGPLDGRLMVSTPQGQELEAAVGAIQNDMLALTRVPGIGSQSDLEAKIANLKYPSIYNHPSVNAANVQQLKAFMGDLRSQITGSPAQGGRTVVRTGTSNGRKVFQYSDGSVEYGN